MLKKCLYENLILDGLFSENVTVKVIQFFRLSSFLCITVKSRSKWEKLSLKTLIIPRVRLTIEFSSFFIYATILPFFVDFGGLRLQLARCRWEDCINLWNDYSWKDYERVYFSDFSILSIHFFFCS